MVKLCGRDLSKLLTIAQAAKSTPYSEPQIRDRIKDGRLKAIRVAGAIYVHLDDLDQLMNRHHPSE
jgi:excisionase family DNA binding protein